MKKKLIILTLLTFSICFIGIIFGFEIQFCKDAWANYNYVYNAGAYQIDFYLQKSIQHTVVCVLAGIALCSCIAMLIIILKSDIGFMKESFLAKHAANKAKREEIRAQEENKRKAARISELEKELNELKKGGE